MKSILRLTSHDPEAYFREVAEVHARCIEGFLSLLGAEFLAQLYRHLVRVPRTGVWCFLEGERVLGFVCGCADVKETYRSLVVRSWFPLMRVTMPSLLKRKTLRKLCGVLIYPFRQGSSEGSRPGNGSAIRAELLAIAVRQTVRRSGIGTKLVRALEAGMGEWGITGEYQVSTLADDPLSNAFYSRMGFAPYMIQKLYAAAVIRKYRKRIDRETVTKQEGIQ